MLFLSTPILPSQQLSKLDFIKESSWEPGPSDFAEFSKKG